MNKGPLCLIVGMGPGLSAALARRYAAEGFRIAGLARNPGKSDELAADLRAKGAEMEVRAADAGDLPALRAAIAGIQADLGPVETLIYNAYRTTFAKPSQVAPEEMQADFTVNAAAALAATQAVLPAMLTAGCGSVLLTGGSLAIDPTGWLAAASLSATKAGMRSLAYSLNKELADKGIHVGTVTIAGLIKPGTPFAPEAIADAFWTFARDPARPPEVLFKGAAAA